MEVAYGTSVGTVRVVVRHPENIGQAPQIFQSYSVHTCPILRVVLGERHLISGQTYCAFKPVVRRLYRWWLRVAFTLVDHALKCSTML